MSPGQLNCPWEYHGYLDHLDGTQHTVMLHLTSWGNGVCWGRGYSVMQSKYRGLWQWRIFSVCNIVACYSLTQVTHYMDKFLQWRFRIIMKSAATYIILIKEHLWCTATLEAQPENSSSTITCPPFNKNSVLVLLLHPQASFMYFFCTDHCYHTCFAHL